MAALEKQRRGETPTREERAALRRFEQARDEQLRAEHYATIRKKEWREWSGRQDKVLNEQAARYGIPIGRASIHLPDVVRWLHDFLAEHHQQLRGIDSDDPELAGATSIALEEFRHWRAKREELNYHRDRGELVPRSEMRAAMGVFAGVMRRAGETLQRQFGAVALEIFDEALTNAMAQLESHLAGGPAGDGDDAADDDDERQPDDADA